MKSVWSAPMALALVAAAVSAASAQQPYPAQVSEQWRNSCLGSCQTNALFKGRERLCPSYCGCIVQEAQASIPLEVVRQAETDLEAKRSNTPALQRIGQVSNQCQTRVLGRAPSTKPTSNVAR
jgi:hypothetical protein